MSEPVTVVGARVTQMPVPHVPSVRGACELCREPIWLSPASEHALKATPGSRVVCMVCMIGEAVLSDEPVRVAPITPEQAAEMRAWAEGQADDASS